MKLIHAPGACSIGIHVLLEEIGKPYELEAASLQVPPAERPLTRISPKSKVPVLVRDDGSVLTEFPAIAYYLARKNPEKHLLPDDVEPATRALEAMDYCVATIHMQGFQRIFRPGNYSSNADEHDAIKARGRQIFETGYAVMDAALDGKDYVVGEFSIADAALFYVEFWGAARLKVALPPALAAHYDRMRARPAVAAVLEQEGFA